MPSKISPLAEPYGLPEGSLPSMAGEPMPSSWPEKMLVVRPIIAARSRCASACLARPVGVIGTNFGVPVVPLVCV